MILVVDDDPSVREAVVTTLESDGYEVQAVSDGSSALAAVSEHSFDAMVLDVMMPGIDGLAVCRILREQGNRIPILVLTARSEVGDRIAGLDAGADDYLPKPFDIDELGARVRACCGGQRHRNPRCSSGIFLSTRRHGAASDPAGAWISLQPSSRCWNYSSRTPARRSPVR